MRAARPRPISSRSARDPLRHRLGSGRCERDRRPEDVAHRRHTHDRTATPAIEPELLSQVADVRTKRVRGTTVAAPDVGEQSIRGYDVVGALHEGVEDAELRGGEADDQRSPRDLVGLWLKAERAELKPGLCFCAGGGPAAPADRADPERQLAEDVWLRDEVVGAELKTPNDVLSVLASRHDEDRGASHSADLA